MKSPTPPASTFNPWPWALIAFFVALISLIAAFVAFALGQDMELVRQDYYEHEVRYQEQIDRMKRAWLVRDDVVVAYDAQAQSVDIRLPASHARQPATGRILFYRPSDAALDHEVKLHLGADGKQRVSVAELAGGLWNLHVFWEFDGQEYCTKRIVVLTGRKS